MRLSLLLALALAGCAAPGGRWVKTELFFGTARPDGTAVTRREWQTFVKSEIVPRFPGGFTLLEGRGWWRTARGEPVDEDSRLLVLIHRPEDAGRISAVRQRYKERFRQESVLQVTHPVRAEF